MASKEKAIDFETAMKNLENIVEALESGELSLEDAIKRYEEAVGLVGVCQAKLSDAEKKIEVLTRGLNGEFKKKPFAAPNKKEDGGDVE